MSKIRAGIEIPIIPEDFVISEADASIDLAEPLGTEPDPRPRDELFPTDWAFTEVLLRRHFKS